MTKRKPATVRHTLTNPYGRRGQINEVDPNIAEVARYLDSGVIERVTDAEAEDQNGPEDEADIAVGALGEDSAPTGPADAESAADGRTAE